MADTKEDGRTGPYERLVGWITDKVKPYLHDTTDKFVRKSVDRYAKDNPHYARMIEFEIRRRGDGAGLTQDVAEPLVWIGAKSGLAIAIEVVMRPFKNKEAFKWKWIGHATALSIVAQQGVELLRVLPRYKAGLQGSLEMAKDRWRALQETGVDPFSNQTREINKPERKATHVHLNEVPEAQFTRSLRKGVIAPEAISEAKAGDAQDKSR
jgi:hypothetical protein